MTWQSLPPFQKIHNISKDLMLTNCINRFIHRRIPFVGEWRLGCCFVPLGIDDSILMIVRDCSSSVHGNHILDFLIFESQFYSLPPDPFQRGFGNYLQPAASTHIQVTSQGQPVVVTSSSASKKPEVIWRPMTPSFDIRLVASQGFGFGFLNDISVEVVIQDRFVCSIRCCVHLSFSE
jgi:hypothetical protein